MEEPDISWLQETELRESELVHLEAYINDVSRRNSYRLEFILVGTIKPQGPFDDAIKPKPRSHVLFLLPFFFTDSEILLLQIAKKKEKEK